MATILILENEASIGMLLSQVLTRIGHRPEVVSLGEEALVRIEEGGVDLLISDLFLSGMGGLDVLRLLQERSIALPILVISGFIDADVQAQLEGFDNVKGWLRKPFDLGELLERVSRSLAGPSVEGEQDRSAGVTPP